MRKKPMPMAISREELYQLGQWLEAGEKRALFYALYLNGGRISEVLKLQKRDVWMQEDTEPKTMVFKLMTLKEKGDLPLRNNPVIMQGIEELMANEVWQYRNTKENDSDRLFHYSRQRAGNILHKLHTLVRAVTPEGDYEEIEFSLHPHFLRHCRCTHLAEVYGYDNIQLMNFFGWSNPARPLTYTQLDWRAKAKLMLKNDSSSSGQADVQVPVREPGAE